MILQALTRYYEDLLSRGEIAAPGWAPAKISLALYINENGELTQIVPTMDEVSKGKKTVLQPQSKPLPAPVKRASNIASNFLWDNSSYLLGIDQKGKPERSRECFAAAAKLHHAVLDGIDSPNARAILAFFDTWEPDRAAEHPALIRQLDDVTAGGNLVFRVDGRKVEEDAAIREAWQRYRDGGESGVKMQCLVTGKEDEIAAVHPSVKGVRDAQSSGAALVSFNAPAFCSYGREQNYNAPVGKYAAFAYTAALNHLLADSDHVQHIGDTTVVCWAEGADDAYPGFFSAVIGGGTYGGLSDNDLRAALKRLANGLPRRPRRRPEPTVLHSRSRAQRGAPFRPLLSARQLRKADGECERALCKAGDRRCKIFDTPFVGSAERNRTRSQKTGPQSSCVWGNGAGCIFRNSIPCIFDGSCLASHSCRAKRYLGESRYFEGLFGKELRTRKRSFNVFGGDKCAVK